MYSIALSSIVVICNSIVGHREVSMETKGNIYKLVYLGTLTYGSQSWALLDHYSRNKVSGESRREGQEESHQERTNNSLGIPEFPTRRKSHPILNIHGLIRDSNQVHRMQVVIHLNVHGYNRSPAIIIYFRSRYFTLKKSSLFPITV